MKFETVIKDMELFKELYHITNKAYEELKTVFGNPYDICMYNNIESLTFAATLNRKNILYFSITEHGDSLTITHAYKLEEMLEEIKNDSDGFWPLLLKHFGHVDFVSHLKSL